MIIDEKVIMNYPPPPYLSVTSTPSTTGTTSQYTFSNLSTTGKPTLPSLPPHILMQIIYAVFPDDSAVSPAVTPAPPSSSARTRVFNAYDARIFEETKAEKQRKVLFWLTTSLRLVSRHLFIACMHVLRSTYLPSYQSLIRPPYSSDPFPLGTQSSPTTDSNPPAYSTTGLSVSSSSSTREAATGTIVSTLSLTSLQRETTILDRYIALKVRQDVFADDTELHIEREENFRDLFDVAQPRARLEDLVRMYGLRDRVVSAPGMRAERSQPYPSGIVPGSSNNSSLASLQPSSPISPSPSTSSPQLQQGQKQPTRSSRSIFSFLKKTPASPVISHTPPLAKPPIQPLPFSLLTVSFSPRKVGLVYNRTRTIAEVQRSLSPADRRSETLELLARALVRGLREYLEETS